MRASEKQVAGRSYPILEKRLMEYLERAGFVVMKRAADIGAAARGADTRKPEILIQTLIPHRIDPGTHMFLISGRKQPPVRA